MNAKNYCFWLPVQTIASVKTKFSKLETRLGLETRKGTDT